MFDGEEFPLSVQPTDAGVRWSVHVRDGPLSLETLELDADPRDALGPL